MSNNKEKEKEISESFKYAGPISRLMRIFAEFRMASYASDIGEATRGTFPNLFVNTMYGVTLSYIGVDLYIRYNDFKNGYINDLKINTESVLKPIQQYMGYHSIWHAQASLIFPTITIHTIVGATRKIVTKLPWMNPTCAKLMPAGTALAAIPLLIKPLDAFADILMKHTYCRFIGFKPEKRSH